MPIKITTKNIVRKQLERSGVNGLNFVFNFVNVSIPFCDFSSLMATELKVFIQMNNIPSKWKNYELSQSVMVFGVKQKLYTDYEVSVEKMNEKRNTNKSYFYFAVTKISILIYSIFKTKNNVFKIHCNECIYGVGCISTTQIQNAVYFMTFVAEFFTWRQ